MEKILKPFQFKVGEYFWLITSGGWDGGTHCPCLVTRITKDTVSVIQLDSIRAHAFLKEYLVSGCAHWGTIYTTKRCSAKRARRYLLRDRKQVLSACVAERRDWLARAEEKLREYTEKAEEFAKSHPIPSAN